MSEEKLFDFLHKQAINKEAVLLKISVCYPLITDSRFNAEAFIICLDSSTKELTFKLARRLGNGPEDHCKLVKGK